MKRRLIALSMTAIPALGLIASPQPAQAEGELVIGASLARTGRYATIARTTETALDIAVAEINAAGGVNGKKIKVVKFDTTGDPKQAVVAVRKFARDDKVLAIIGPFSSGEARVAFPAGERAKVVQVSNSSTAPNMADKFSYAYRLTESEFLQTIRLVQTLKKKNIPHKTGAILYASDEFVSKIVGKGILEPVFKKEGIKLVMDPIGFPNDAFDLSPQVSQLKGKQIDLVGLGGITSVAIKVLKEMKRQNIQARMIGSQLFADPDTVAKFGTEGDGVMFMTWFWYKRNAATLSFTKKFVDENHKRGIEKPWPHHVDASTYDIVFALKHAMEAAKVTGDPAKLEAERTAIRDALVNVRFEGVVGDICFKKTGDASLPGYVILMKDGGWTLFDTHKSLPCR